MYLARSFQEIKTTDALNHDATTAYDAVGNMRSITDSVGNTTSYTYDLLDRLKTVDNAGTPRVPNVLLSYGYDLVGNLLNVTDTICS